MEPNPLGQLLQEDVWYVCVRLIPVFILHWKLPSPQTSLSLSLDENLREKEGGKEKTGGRLSFSPSHGPLRFIKETAGRNCYQSISLYFFKVNSFRLSFTSSLYKFLFVVLAFNFTLYILRVSELAWCLSWMLRTKPYLDLDHPSLACHSRFWLSSVCITKRLRKTGRLFVSSFSCRHEMLSGTVWT